jgi:hypothetical protein
MGVITGLLALPVTGPLRAFRFLVERIHEEAAAVLHDEGRAFAELIDLSMRHNAGQLSDAEYAAQETELIERLSSIREYRDELLHAELDVDDDETFDAERDVDEDEWRDAGLDEDEEDR